MALKIGLAAALLFIIAAALSLPGIVEARMNPVLHPPPYPAPEWARELSRGSVDLHADPLLWGRDLSKRASRGQVDVPRLLEAQAGRQIFAGVALVPRVRHDPGTFDLLVPLYILSGWPPRVWFSPKERALYQAARLKRLPVSLVRSRADLRPGQLGAMLALEGAQSLEGDLNNVDALFEAGFRMMSPVHFADSEIGGSTHGLQKTGLTPLGEKWLKKLEEKRIIVDLAHASPRTIDDVLARATRPVVVSHTGVRGTCDNERNLSDDQLRALAKNGALVGIGYWEVAVCGKDAAAIARAMRHAANVMGVEHIALGSDFDGAVAVPFDVTGLPLLMQALRAERFSDEEIRAIARGNALRLLSQILP